MLARFRHRSRVGRALAACLALGLIAFTPACDKVPLMAPSGTVITLFATSTNVPLNSETEFIVTAIENGTTSTPSTGGGTGGGGTGGTPTTPTSPTSTSSTGAGTPVQNGTLITFTTTIGRIEPSEARTTNGQVRVKLITSSQSGTATITAFSGGASGKLENLKIGTAAVERVLLSATPQTLGASGGNAEIQARVEDTSGAGVPGVSVTFTADVGTLSAGSATTDSSGVAKVTLNTTAKSTITANVAGKTATVAVALNPRTGIAITPPTGSIAAGQSATFTVNVSATANIRNVVVSWGDGRTQNVGAISTSTPVTHIYSEPGTYTVTATATDASGFSEPAITTIVVLPAQPPSVTVTSSNSTPTINETVILRATVSGNTSSILSYSWNFGADSNQPPITITSNQAPASWNQQGTKVITVTVTQASGPSGDGFGTVTVRSTTGTIKGIKQP